MCAAPWLALTHEQTSLRQNILQMKETAQSAIGVIAKALLTGQTAPADARDDVKTNLEAANDALTSIQS